MVDLTHHWGCRNLTHKLLTSPMTPWRPHPYLIIRERCGTKHLQSLRRSEDPTVQRQKYITFCPAIPLQVHCGSAILSIQHAYCVQTSFIFSRPNTNKSSYACGTGIAWRPAAQASPCFGSRKQIVVSRTKWFFHVFRSAVRSNRRSIHYFFCLETAPSWRKNNRTESSDSTSGRNSMEFYGYMILALEVALKTLTLVG